MFGLIEKELGNVGITENGAVGYKTAGSHLVDINYQISSLRNETEEYIRDLFEKAYFENPEYALKWLFFARDAREGIGERRLFRICYKKLAELNEDAFIKNLINIQEFGRFDDLVNMIGINYTIDMKIIEIIKKQLNEDLQNSENGKSISLLAKWMPSENASSKDTKVLAKKIRKMLKMSPKTYRVMLSKLRAYSDVVEVKTCKNRWNEINYENVPSMANLRYKNAFLRHDKERRIAYLESVMEGNKKMNMSVATPVDIVTRYDSWFVREEDQTLETAWKNLKNVGIEDTLVVADGSGSMTVEVSGRTTALDVANSLAIYTSERNTGVYKNKYITFSSRPQFVSFEEDDSLQQKLKTAREHNEISNTNIKAVFDLILQIAVMNKVPKEEMIKNILIISDMEFDRAQRGFGRDVEILSNSLFNVIKDDYAKQGYKLPKLIFWNVNSRTKTIPLIENELGVTLVSGFSQNVLQMVMSNKYDPYEVLVDTITKERYEKIKL